MLSRFARHVQQQFVGYIALFIALGGVSYAAIALPKNSIGSKQIAKGAVKTSELGKNAVNSAKVKDGSLVPQDFAAGAIPGPSTSPGPQGPQGLQGPQGEKGEKGDIGEPGQSATSLFANIVDTGDAPTATVGTSTKGTVSVSDPAGANDFINPYVVTFNRDLTGCVAQATQGRAGAAGSGLIAIMSADVTGSTVRVFSQRHDGTLADTAFMVSVFC